MRRYDEPITLPETAQAPPARSMPERLGRYELLFELARGGMGAVYVARLLAPHGFDRLVAIKCLSTGAGPTDVAAFLDEARVTAKIDHPSVVQTLELGEHDGQPFLVMQLVQGVSLARLLEELRVREEKIGPEIAAWIAAQAASGLHAAHELRGPDGQLLQLVHRDVSPQNILLSFEGRVYVADFGVAKFKSDRSTQGGVVKGKFGYMSPEQAFGRTLDRRSDVFSLGVVLHEAICGKRLFPGDAPAQVVLGVVNAAVPSPSETRADIDEGLATIVMRCLEKDADARFATAGELAEALRAWLRARPRVDEGELAALLARLLPRERARLEARMQASRQGVPRPAARGPRMRAVGIALVAMALAALATVLWLSRKGYETVDARASTAPPPADSMPKPEPLEVPMAAPSPAASSAPAPPAAASVVPASTIVPSQRPSIRRPQATATATTDAAPTRTQAAPAPSSSAGRPFDSLGP